MAETRLILVWLSAYMFASCLALWCIFPQRRSTNGTFPDFRSRCLDLIWVLGHFSVTIKVHPIIGWSRQPWRPSTSYIAVPCSFNVHRHRQRLVNLSVANDHNIGMFGMITTSCFLPTRWIRYYKNSGFLFKLVCPQYQCIAIFLYWVKKSKTVHYAFWKHRCYVKATCSAANMHTNSPCAASNTSLRGRWHHKETFSTMSTSTCLTPPSHPSHSRGPTFLPPIKILQTRTVTTLKYYKTTTKVVVYGVALLHHPVVTPWPISGLNSVAQLSTCASSSMYSHLVGWG